MTSEISHTSLSKEFITKNLLDKNGNPSRKKKEKFLSESVIEEILSKHNTDDLNTAIYCELHKLSPPTCEVCHEKTTKISSFKAPGFQKTCSHRCASILGGKGQKRKFQNISQEEKDAIQKKREETNLKRYGVRYHLQDPETSKKAKKAKHQTWQEKYGCHPWQVPEIYNKSKQTWISNGYTNPGLASNRTSKAEIKIVELVESLGYDCVQSYRTPDSEFEIDVFIPELRIGIECHGEFWHSDSMNAKGRRDYHYKKYLDAKKRGIFLMQFFNTEIERGIADHIIRHKLNMSERIYARNTDFKRIEFNDARKFLSLYHARGFVASSYYFGLYHNDTLVSVMSFKKQNSEKVELNRFASSYSVVGGFSKLLSNAKQQLHIDNFKEIESFLDLRFSTEDSNIYRNNGFVEVDTLKPDYYYFYKGNLIHKFNMRKTKLQKLGAIGRTEREMAESIGALRIYDCGKIKYSLKI